MAIERFEKPPQGRGNGYLRGVNLLDSAEQGYICPREFVQNIKNEVQPICGSPRYMENYISFACCTYLVLNTKRKTYFLFILNDTGRVMRTLTVLPSCSPGIHLGIAFIARMASLSSNL